MPHPSEHLRVDRHIWGVNSEMFVRGGYQPREPGPPLKGPATVDVIHPP
jgi:hypothetical protein